MLLKNKSSLLVMIKKTIQEGTVMMGIGITAVERDWALPTRRTNGLYSTGVSLAAAEGILLRGSTRAREILASLTQQNSC